MKWCDVALFRMQGLTEMISPIIVEVPRGTNSLWKVNMILKDSRG